MKKINSDRIVAISAMLISLLTLIIFLYQTSLMEEQSRLSVRPRLSFNMNIGKTISVKEAGVSSDTTVTVWLSIKNNGLGPAIINDGWITYNNTTFEGISFFNTELSELNQYGVMNTISELNEGQAIPVTEEIILFQYSYDSKYELQVNEILPLNEAYQFPFTITVDYASMYEEVWRIESNHDGHPRKL